MRVICLTQEFWAQVDDEDFAWLSQWSWYAHVRRRKRSAIPYAMRKERRKMLAMHIALAQRYGFWKPDLEIDHWDGNRINNQKWNLRPVSGSQNQWNQLPRSGTSSRYKGVCWLKDKGLWRASIKQHYRKFYLGQFQTEEEAARAYDRKALELFGPHARLNFPVEIFPQNFSRPEPRSI